MVNGVKKIQENGKISEQVATKIGKIIRPLHLDELPQLVNIIKGQMSFVGPRPLAIEEYAHHVKLDPNYQKICSNKPGLTSLDAVLVYLKPKVRNKIINKLGLKLASNKTDSKFSKSYHERKKERELFYFKNKSFILDTKIVFWTFIMVLDRKSVV